MAIPLHHFSSQFSSSPASLSFFCFLFSPSPSPASLPPLLPQPSFIFFPPFPSTLCSGSCSLFTVYSPSTIVNNCLSFSLFILPCRAVSPSNLLLHDIPHSHLISCPLPPSATTTVPIWQRHLPLASHDLTLFSLLVASSSAPMAPFLLLPVTDQSPEEREEQIWNLLKTEQIWPELCLCVVVFVLSILQVLEHHHRWEEEGERLIYTPLPCCSSSGGAWDDAPPLPLGGFSCEQYFRGCVGDIECCVCI